MYLSFYSFAEIELCVCCVTKPCRVFREFPSNDDADYAAAEKFKMPILCQYSFTEKSFSNNVRLTEILTTSIVEIEWIK